MTEFAVMLRWPIPESLSFLLELTVRGAAVLAVALGAARLVAGASATLRHRIWTLSFATLLALPALSALLPSWRIPVLPAAEAAALAEPSPAGEKSVDPRWRGTPGRAAAGAVRGAGASDALPRPPGVPAAAGESASGAPGREIAAGAAQAGGATGGEGAGLAAHLLLALWLGGFGVLTLRMALHHLRALRIRRRAAELDDPGWAAEAREVAARLGIRRTVPLLRSSEVTVPTVSGIVRPVLLLPTDAPDWEGRRRRAALVHELTHVKRRDCLTRLLAQAGRALHWVNPLAWSGYRMLVAEQERACDDAVLSAGTPRVDYAEQLLALARRGSPGEGERAPGLAMARPGELEGRLRSVLDPLRPRGRPGRIASAGTYAVALALVCVLSALDPARASAGSAGPKAQDRPASLTPDRAGLSRPEAGPAPQHPPQRVPPADTTPASGAPGPVPGAAPAREPSDSPSPGVARGAVSASGAQAGDARATSADTTAFERALAAMTRALGSDDPGLRAVAARALGQTEDTAAVDALVEAFPTEPDPAVREAVARALGMIEDPRAVEVLGPGLRDGSPGIRAAAAWALGMIEDPRAADDLALVLDDDDADVREQAAWALGMTGSADAVEPLTTALLEDDEPRIRRQAARALGAIDDPAATDALLRAAEGDADPGVRRDALEALGSVMERPGNR